MEEAEPLAPDGPAPSPALSDAHHLLSRRSNGRGSPPERLMLQASRPPWGANATVRVAHHGDLPHM